MNMFTKLCLIVLAASVVQASVLPSRVKRQNFNWGDYDEDTQRPPRRTTAPSSTPSAAGTTTTTASPEYLACVSRCPPTSQYNPICGTNRITYNNASHLKCAKGCGLVVEQLFQGTCSPL